MDICEISTNIILSMHYVYYMFCMQVVSSHRKLMNTSRNYFVETLYFGLCN